MMVYDLKCANGHVFEGWFEDSRAFEKQQQQGLVACPVCNHTDIQRIPSTFAIKAAPSRRGEQSPKLDTAIMAKAISDYVESNFDNVGADFAKEALKIHYGVSEPRNIRGFSTSQEEETLRAEGVSFMKFPAPVDTDTTPSSSDTDQ